MLPLNINQSFDIHSPLITLVLAVSLKTLNPNTSTSNEKAIEIPALH